MAIETHNFTTGATSHAYVAPTLWSNAIEKQVYEAEIMRPLGITDTRGFGTAGKQINVAKGNTFTVSALTDGTETPVTAITYDQVTVTFVEYGDAKQVSMKEVMEAFESTMADMTYNAGQALGVARDNIIIDALDAGATATIYSNDVVATTITASDTMNTALLADAKTAGRLLNFNKKVIVIHPNCENSLFKLSAFVDASQYGGREAVLNGEVGRYLGMVIISHNNINTTTENTSFTVYKNLALGERSFVFAPKKSAVMEWEREANRDRAVTLHYWEVYGVSVLNAESIHILKAVGG
jgi:N4-gp56 family major capsid protein